MASLIMTIYTVLFEKLKIKRAQDERHNQFFFPKFQKNEIFETLKIS